MQKWGGGVEEDRVHAKGKAISNLDSSVTPLAALPVTSSWLFVILVFLVYMGYLGYLGILAISNLYSSVTPLAALMFVSVFVFVLFSL